MDGDIGELRCLERRRCDALMSGDMKALAALLAEDLVHIHGTGQIEDRRSYLHSVETRLIFHKVERGDLDIRLRGDWALMVGPLEQVVEARGSGKRNRVSAVVSQTWTKSAGGWRQDSCHMHFLSTE